MSTPAEALEQATQPRPIEEIREAFQRIHHRAIGKTDRAYMSIPADPKRDADIILSAAIDELERLRGLVPELPPRPPDGTGLPRYGLRWNGPGQPLAVPMADGYWTPWHLAEAEWARCMVERSSDLEAGEAAVRVAKGLRDQRDQTKRDLDRLRVERADLVATYERTLELLRAQDFRDHPVGGIEVVVAARMAEIEQLRAELAAEKHLSETSQEEYSKAITFAAESLTRLRGLIKKAETTGYNTAVCPWCSKFPKYSDKHAETCPAFTPGGDVR